MRKFLFLLMAVILAIGQLHAQQRTVTGKVTNERGEIVPNASVIIKGTTVGTTTLTDGSFSISVPSNARTLVITSVGLGTTELALTNSTNYSVVLSSTAKNLDEVVVVAYGAQKRTNVTGAIATVKPAAIENKPFTSVDKALQGAVAGLQSTSTSGAPGAFTDIRIRGQGSISAGNDPLWVIDGIVAQTGDLTTNTTTANILSTLNPDDIESISILKDASAASIYGSRAANGVIIVTTKRGRAGKTVFNFSAEAGQNSIAYKNNKNRSMTTGEYQSQLELALINAGYAANNSDADAIITDPVNGFGLKPGVNTNWYDVVTHNASQQQYNLSMSGGNEKTQFYISGGYFTQGGTTLATDFTRYNGSVSITHKATDRLTISALFNGAGTKQTTPTNGGTFANPVLESYFLLPWYSPYNANGSFKYNDAEGQFPANGGIFNPLIQANWNKNNARQTSLIGNLSGEYKILNTSTNNLKITSRFAGEYIDVSEDSYRNPFYGDGFAQGGDAFASYRRVTDYTWSNFADYRHDFNSDLYFDLKAGYESQFTRNYLLQAGGQGFPLNLQLNYLTSAATPTTAFTVPQQETTNSIFSSGDVIYKDKYVLSASFRRDGSSVFGANHRWGNFYSVGGSWNISEEDFIKNIPAISLLKLRASYGENGNASNFGYYSSLATYGYGANYTGLPGSVPTNVGNDNLTWEKNAIGNIGLDFALFKDRLNGTIEVYNRKTSDLLLSVPLSLTSGFAGQNQNVGAMTNKGIEISLGGTPVKLKNFSWTISANFAHNTNKVTELYSGRPILNSFQQIAVGQDAQTFYLRQWAGVDPANGDPLWYTDGTRKATTNNYSTAKLGYNGQSDPKYFGSVTNTFTFKGFSLSGQFYYNFGNDVYDIWDRYLNSDGLYYGSFNQETAQLDSWKKPGDKTDVPKIIYGGNKNSYNHSTRYLYDGKYIRLRDAQISYTLPKSVISRAHLSNVTVYVRGTNILTFDTDKRLPFDPEAGEAAQSNFDVFIPKTITGGIKLTF
ncbi:MAG TPA: TonB-dependent receptor [Chitinophagaceae bacterium]|jgi:TonB-linked SusC/RagA family outer membrane protein